MKNMNKWMELLLGLVLIIAPIVLAFGGAEGGVWGLGTAALEFLKGALMWIVFVFGLLFIILGISDLKS